MSTNCSAAILLQYNETIELPFVPICPNVITLMACAKGIQFMLFVVVITGLVAICVRTIKGKHDFVDQSEAENKYTEQPLPSQHSADGIQVPAPAVPAESAPASEEGESTGMNIAGRVVNMMGEWAPWMFLLLGLNITTLGTYIYSIVSLFFFILTMLILNCCKVGSMDASPRVKMCLDMGILVWVFFWFINYLTIVKMPYSL